jgi:hypothetical protein
MAGARNIISGNLGVGGSSVIKQAGVIIFGGASNSVVQGNYIGTDITGTLALGNGTNGIQILGAINNTIGGTTPTAGNLISGNQLSGVDNVNAVNFFGFTGPSTGNVVQANFIGTDVTGGLALPNQNDGVLIQGGASSNTIGGTAAGAGNVIAFNNGVGVAVGASAADTGSVNNSIRGNSIFSNAHLGIDLGNDEVTPNHLGSATGPNDFENFPVLLRAIAGSSTEIVGNLNSLANMTFALDFFANTAADPSGFGQGRRYLGSTSVTTDTSGNASFDVTLIASTSAADFITATATDPIGNTSEFSQDIQADVPPQVSFNAPSTIPVGLTVPLTASIVDSDPTKTYSFNWNVLFNGQPVTLPNPALVGGTPTNEETFLFTPEQVGTYQIELTVTDSRGGISTSASRAIRPGVRSRPAPSRTSSSRCMGWPPIPVARVWSCSLHGASR